MSGKKRACTHPSPPCNRTHVERDAIISPDVSQASHGSTNGIRFNEPDQPSESEPPRTHEANLHPRTQLDENPPMNNNVVDLTGEVHGDRSRDANSVTQIATSEIAKRHFDNQNAPPAKRQRGITISDHPTHIRDNEVTARLRRIHGDKRTRGRPPESVP